MEPEKRRSPPGVLLAAWAVGLISATTLGQSDARAPGSIVFVDASAPLGGDGLSWVSAFCELQDALAVAEGGQQVWVAAGTYSPDPSKLDKSTSFSLASGCSLYGGFAGNERSLSERDPVANLTILSGDLLGDDADGLDHTADNSIHVVRVVDASQLVRLDGFIIRGGAAFGAEVAGGGLSIEASAVTIEACSIESNAGSGVFARSSSLEMNGCVVSDNLAGHGAGVFLSDSILKVDQSTFADNMAGFSSMGGGLLVDAGSSCEIVDSAFTGNGASFGAGLAITGAGSSALVSRTRFVANSSGGSGAAVHVRGTSPSVAGSGASAIPEVSIQDCEFVGNDTKSFGAGVAVQIAGNAVVQRSTFVANTAKEQGASVAAPDFGSIVIDGCVMWANSAKHAPALDDEVFATTLASLSATSSDIEVVGGAVYPGVGNSNVDPQFVDMTGVDGVVGSGDEDLRLRKASPCIDAGGLNDFQGVDLSGTPRWIDGDLDGVLRIDMGAHEFSNVGLEVGATDKSVELSVSSEIPMLGFLLVGRHAGDVLVLPYGGLLIDPAAGLTRYALGVLPMAASVPASALVPALFDDSLVVQALGVLPELPIGNFSRSCEVSLVGLPTATTSGSESLVGQPLPRDLSPARASSTPEPGSTLSVPSAPKAPARPPSLPR